MTKDLQLRLLPEEAANDDTLRAVDRGRHQVGGRVGATTATGCQQGQQQRGGI